MSPEHQPITFNLTSSITELDRLSEKMSWVGEQWDLSGKTVLQINLALDELFTNVVSYGLEEASGHQITFTLSNHGNEIRIVVTDSGKAFDPTQAPDPILEAPLEDQQVGGLGIFLIRQYTDHIDYKRAGGKNITTLVKKI